ncbi:1,4-dihydroxy-2-naphthoate octaprenyltransferase [Jejuia pallidilutea]|uniref:1,4-dihydroxy-2-naphthoate octaprenyltransferase n=2 Tax=Jejuia pallidilutea TaxID=504487 RepID=A0A098LV38_9FLAO|nr:1,4-dihydroxy-2-naphthoate octaprenyltransferase [Jejuia pallidilutea]GAL90761.1 1,4-dihydroxy-2-naphthoate polyprenyltransferase [Jejuia pallidilutea]
MDSIMKNVSIWISAMRLRTLPLSVSGIIVASSFAAYNGCFNLQIFLLAILTTISLQILSNLANDYGDGVKGTDDAERIGPERAIQSGKITPNLMFEAIKLNILVCIVLSFLLIFSAFGSQHFLLTLLYFVLGIASVIAAIKYTIGSKAYGYRGLGDAYVFIFFGLVSVIGCYVLYAKTVHHVVFLPAITIGLLSVAVLNLNNMRDIISDKASGKITLAVKLGVTKAKTYHLFLIISAIVVSALWGILYYTSPLNLIYFIAYIPLIKHIKTVKHNNAPQDLDPELKKVALSTFFLSVLLAVGHLF